MNEGRQVNFVARIETQTQLVRVEFPVLISRKGVRGQYEGKLFFQSEPILVETPTADGVDIGAQRAVEEQIVFGTAVLHLHIHRLNKPHLPLIPELDALGEHDFPWCVRDLKQRNFQRTLRRQSFHQYREYHLIVNRRPVLKKPKTCYFPTTSPLYNSV